MTQKDRTLEDIFSQSGFDLTQHQLRQFRAFLDLITGHNKELDLTRITKHEDIITKHFIDSIYITRFIDLPSPILDIGTGAGFPGIPLKIILPHLRVVLAEPRHKRAAFLEMALQRLGLVGIEVYPHLVTEKSFFTVQGAITRALEDVNATLSRVLHFLPHRGVVVFMKGPDSGGDMEGISAENENNYDLVEDRAYSLPGTDHRRRLLVFSKKISSMKKTYFIMKEAEKTPGHAITSRDNKKFKDLKKITTTEGMRKSGLIPVSGKKLIADALKEKKVRTKNLIIFDGYAEEDPSFLEIIEKFTAAGNLFILKKSLYNEIDIFNSGSPILIVEAPPIPEWDRRVVDGCTLLVPFQDPANVGMAIRSAAGFGVGTIVLLRESAHPFHPRAIRASAGTVFSADLRSGPSIYDLKSYLGDSISTLVTLDRDGYPLSSFAFPEKFLLLSGIEGPGLPEPLKNNSVSIPLHEDIDSLNGATALSIALYEWRRQK